MIQLLHDRVLIRRIPIPEKTRGGIILPLKAIELPQIGHIVAIGPHNPDLLAVGSMVIIRRFEGQRVWLNGEELHLLRIEDLLAEVRE